VKAYKPYHREGWTKVQPFAFSAGAKRMSRLNQIDSIIKTVIIYNA
jgi:hypothetical protein